MRVSLCFAQVKNAMRSLGNATPRSFHSRVWRNWQLGERAHPVGDEASSIKAQKQGEFRADARKATMLQESRGRGCPKTIKYAGVFDTALISFAGVAELADAQDLGSCVNSCRFKSCHPHQKHKDGFCRPYVFRMSLLTQPLSNSQELDGFAS